MKHLPLFLTTSSFDEDNIVLSCCNDGMGIRELVSTQSLAPNMTLNLGRILISIQVSHHKSLVLTGASQVLMGSS